MPWDTVATQQSELLGMRSSPINAELVMPTRMLTLHRLEQWLMSKIVTADQTAHFRELDVVRGVTDYSHVHR